MSRAYLFIYDANVGTRDEVKNALSSVSLITHWRYDIPNCFYVVSDGSAQELYDQFVSVNGTKGRFMFIEASSNRQGQMLPDTWHLLTHKTYKPKSK